MFGLDKHQMYIASVVATYWFVSINMVYLNKVLMSNKDISIPAPLFVTWFQCVVTAIICWVAGKTGERFRQSAYQQVHQEDGGIAEEAKPSFWAQFPVAEYKIGVGRRVFPLSFVFVGMITFNNLCLKWVEVSFYNVARSLTIVFNVFLSNALLGSSTSSKTMLCLGLVILGFFMGSQGESNFSIYGTVAGIFSSLFVSLNSIYTKKILPAVDNDHWRLTFYNNINACILFLPMILVFEHQALAAAVNQQFLSGIFWSAMSVAGFFGFSIGIVTVLQIKATSPLTHNISGTAKAAVQSMMAFYIWGNEATLMGVLGIFTVLGGSLLYTFVKMSESKANSTPRVAEQKTDVEMQKPVRGQAGTFALTQK
jgi:GDP-fucose transporter C1